MTQPGFLSPEEPDRHVHDTHAPHLLFSDTHSSIPRGPLGSGEESDLGKMAPGKGWALSVMTRMGKQPVGRWGASCDMPRAYSV